MRGFLAPRGSGRTRQQIAEAPRGAYFVWRHADLHYPQQLALSLERDDLQFVTRLWLARGGWRGSRPSGVVVDHSVSLSREERASLRRLRREIQANRLAEHEVVALLRGIQAGEIGLIARYDEPADVYAGDVEYLTSNGWTVVVFNDCDTWDYLDRIIAPDGRQANFEELLAMRLHGSDSFARPTLEEEWEVWGIPAGDVDPRTRWPGWQRHLFETM